MTALVWFYAGVLIGLSVFLALPGWREANRQLNADIEFMRSIPQGVEGEDK